MSKTDDGETIHYVSDINLTYEQVIQTYGDDGQVVNTYTYGLERIQSKGKDNETYLYDGRGSVVGVINQDNILESYSYTAYGELMPSSPAPKVWGYNGEARDSKTGLQYLRARYYDSSINRFMCEDDYRGDFTNPISMNRYVYVHNNPVMGIDPSGYYMSGVPSNIQTDLNRQKRINKGLKYANRYGGKKAVANFRRSVNNQVTAKYYAKNKNISNNTKIVPEALVPGEAGWWGGDFCSDGGTSKIKEMELKGIPGSVITAIVSSAFNPMSNNEVRNRNEALNVALESVNTIWTSPATITGYGKYAPTYYKGEEYRGLIYSMNNYHDSPNSFINALEKGVGEFYREDGYHLAGQDCSGEAMRIWGFETMSTRDIHDNISKYKGQTAKIFEVGVYDRSKFYIANIDEIADYTDEELQKKIATEEEKDTLEEAYKKLAPGDQVYKRGLQGHHIMTVMEVDGDNFIFQEQAQPTTRISQYTSEELSDQYYMPITKDFEISRSTDYDE